MHLRSIKKKLRLKNKSSKFCGWWAVLSFHPLQNMLDKKEKNSRRKTQNQILWKEKKIKKSLKMVIIRLKQYEKKALNFVIDIYFH